MSQSHRFINPLRVYVDTSVFGGVFDDIFSAASSQFFERVKEGCFIILVSSVVVDEPRSAPDRVQRVLSEIPESSVEIIDVTSAAKKLCDRYLQEGIVGGSSENDAMHVAIATDSGASAIVSWNFKHIVNYDKIHKYNGINMLLGYGRIDIYSPNEMFPRMERMTKNKDFHCVEMKNECQKKSREEFDRRRADFRSYVDYVNAMMEETEWAKSIMSKFRRVNRGS